MEQTKTLAVVITAEQVEQLKKGYVVEALGSKTKLMLVDGVPHKVTAQNSNKPRFTTFYAPRRSTTLVCAFSEADFVRAIAEYKEHGGEDMARIRAYKRNGEKDANGNNVPLEKQIENGTARVIAFAVTRKIDRALKTDGILQAYCDSENVCWYLRDDVEEITEGLTASNWKVDNDTIIQATINAPIQW